MSVKELKLTQVIGDEISVTHDGKEFEFYIGVDAGYYIRLDRNQASLLLMYLQEHLK